MGQLLARAAQGAAAALLFTSACGLVAPLEELNRTPAQGADAGTHAGPPSNGSCKEEALRCSGSTPQVCRENRWRAAGDDCEFACDRGECTGVCVPDDRECKDGAARLCSDLGEWQSQKCPGTCVDGKCATGCEDGAKQCAAEQKLEVCDDSRFVPVETCDAACVVDKCSGECKPGKQRCSTAADASPERCDKNGKWQTLAACGDDTPVCVGGQCAVCEPKSKTCLDDMPSECNDAGSWEPQALCEASTETCFDGECVTCEPLQLRCTGNVLEACADDGSAWETSELCQGETPVCIPSLKVCGACLDGDRECMGDTPQICNDQGRWLAEAPCANETPACIGPGECVACDPNETPTRCSDQTMVQSCSDAGEWGIAAPCTEVQDVCRNDTNRCGCKEDSARCTSNVGRELCSMGMWVAQAACEGVTDYCLPSSGLCVECEPGEETCQTNSALRCDVAGAFQPLNACAGTTVNCGGCDLKEPCTENDQCLSNNCVFNACAVAENCSNGLDDDGDGDPDCADAACMDVACVDLPNGWLGPVVVATDEFAGLPAACPTEFSAPLLAVNADPSADPVVCSACSCTDALSCDGAQLAKFTTCAGPPPPTNTPVADGQCVPLTVLPGEGVALVAGSQAGTCSVQGGGAVTATPPAGWNVAMKACGQAATVAVGCGATQACLPALPPTDFESRYCVYRAGEETCPSGYINRRVFYSEIQDTRACTACACDAQGDCNTAAWQPFGQASCAADPQTPSDACAVGPCACGAPPAAATSISYNPTLSCESSGGDPSGTVAGTVASAVTVCCVN